MKSGSRAVFALSVLIAGPGSAVAGPCDAFFDFDGNLADISGNGHDGRMVARDGVPASPRYVAGKSGQALRMDGDSAMRAMLDLHPENCPQLTLMAWIKVDPGAAEGHVIGTEGQEGPGLRYFDSSLQMLGPAYGVVERNILFPDTWTFIALVYDSKNELQRLHWDGRNSERPMGDMRLLPGPAVWVGAYGPRLNYAASGVLIDELRIVGEALDPREIADFRDSIGGNGSEAAIAASGSPAIACSSNAGCAEGYYCAVDETCHPESHRPMNGSGSGTSFADTQRDLMQENSERAEGIDYQAQGELLSSESSGRALNDAEKEYLESVVEDRRAPELTADEAGSTGSASSGEDTDPSDGAGGSDPAEERRIAGWTLSRTDSMQTPIAGVDGDVIRTLELDDSFLTAIDIFDPTDVPCGVVLEGQAADLRESINECVQVMIPTGLDVFFGARIGPAAIRSAQICKSFQNDRVKGIRVSGNLVLADGSFGAYQQDQEDRPNCGEWIGIVDCGTGYVASGVTLHFQERSGSNALVGLGLVCRGIEKIYD